jgi:hypothetical protein
MDRRRFLVSGGLLALSPFVFGSDLRRLALADPPGPLHRLAQGDGPHLSIGYLALPELPAGVSDLAAGHRVIPAGRLGAGDPSLAGGRVNVRVLGATPGLNAQPAGRDVDLDAQPAGRDVDLDALFPVGDSLVPFYAWTHRSQPRPSTSSPTAFAVTVGDDAALALRLTVTGGGRPAPDVSHAVLTAGRDRGLTALRRGVYLLGLEPAVWDAATALPHPDDPAWSRQASLVVSVDRA